MPLPMSRRLYVALRWAFPLWFKSNNNNSNDEIDEIK